MREDLEEKTILRVIIGFVTSLKVFDSRRLRDDLIIVIFKYMVRKH